MPEVDAFIGLDQVRRAGRDHRAGRGRERSIRGRRGKSFVTPRADLHSRLRYAALSPHPGAQRLPENRRGLQSSLQLLRHPANARAASQPPARLRPRRDAAARRRRREGNQSHQPGHDLLRNGFVGGESRAAPAGRFVARSDADGAAARDRKDRGRFLGPPALHPSGALER